MNGLIEQRHLLSPGTDATSADTCPLDWCLKLLYCEGSSTAHIHRGRSSLIQTPHGEVSVSPSMSITSEGSSGPRVHVRVEDHSLRGVTQQDMTLDLPPSDALAFADALEAAAAGNTPQDQPAAIGTVDDFEIFEGDFVAVTLLARSARLGRSEHRLVNVSVEWGHEDWSPTAEILDKEATTLARFVRMCVAEVTR